MKRAIAQYAKMAEKVDKDFALYASYYSSATLAVSDFYDALVGLEYSGKIMGGYEKPTAKDIIALIGSESAKVFKGDPYERAMNSFYLGIIDYARGDYDNALASFKNGLLMDAGSKEEKYREDFSLLHFMKAKALYRLGEKEEAEKELDKAIESRLFQLKQWRNHLSGIREMYNEAKLKCAEADSLVDQRLRRYNNLKEEYEQVKDKESDKFKLEGLKYQLEMAKTDLDSAEESANRYRLLLNDLSEEQKDIENAISMEKLHEKEVEKANFLKGLLSNNTLFILEIGRGPGKVARGRYGEIAKIKDNPCEISYAELYLDGEKFAKALKIEDLYYQAITRGERKITGWLKTKGDIKIGLETAGEVLLAYGIEEKDKKKLGAGALLLLSSLLLDPRADTRCWETLPRELHIVSADIQEGFHTVEFRFYDRNSNEISKYTQVYPFVPFKKNKDNIYLVRTSIPSYDTENLYLKDAQENWERLLVAEASKKDRDDNKITTLKQLLSASQKNFVCSEEERNRLIKYCFDGIGHKPGTYPFIFGGTCCCTPTEELLEKYHKDGFLLDYTLESLLAEYKKRGIVLKSAEHNMCNNYCAEGPHIVKGGRCMVPPSPLTRNFIEVATGIWDSKDVESRKRPRLFR